MPARRSSSPLVTGLALVALAAMAAEAQQWTAPAFCKGQECPRYTVVKKLPSGAELRRYEPSSWVATRVEGMTKEEATQGSFMKLFRYISGANAAGTKIPMTSPVLTKVQPGAGPTCESKFTTAFYNPYKYQGPSAAAVPKPTAADVSITSLPAMEVWVLSFPGFSSDSKDQQMAAKLVAELKAAKEPFSDAMWFTAGYDSPFTLTNRHNEVWIPKNAPPSKAAKEAAPKAAAAAPKAAGR